MQASFRKMIAIWHFSQYCNWSTWQKLIIEIVNISTIMSSFSVGQCICSMFRRYIQHMLKGRRCDVRESFSGHILIQFCFAFLVWLIRADICLCFHHWFPFSLLCLLPYFGPFHIEAGSVVGGAKRRQVMLVVQRNFMLIPLFLWATSFPILAIILVHRISPTMCGDDDSASIWVFRFRCGSDAIVGAWLKKKWALKDTWHVDLSLCYTCCGHIFYVLFWKGELG